VRGFDASYYNLHIKTARLIKLFHFQYVDKTILNYCISIRYSNTYKFCRIFFYYLLIDKVKRCGKSIQKSRTYINNYTSFSINTFSLIYPSSLIIELSSKSKSTFLCFLSNISTASLDIAVAVLPNALAYVGLPLET